MKFVSRIWGAVYLPTVAVLGLTAIATANIVGSVLSPFYRAYCDYQHAKSAGKSKSAQVTAGLKGFAKSLITGIVAIPIRIVQTSFKSAIGALAEILYLAPVTGYKQGTNASARKYFAEMLLRFHGPEYGFRMGSRNSHEFNLTDPRQSTWLIHRMLGKSGYIKAVKFFRRIANRWTTERFEAPSSLFYQTLALIEHVSPENKTRLKSLVRKSSEPELLAEIYLKLSHLDLIDRNIDRLLTDINQKAGIQQLHKIINQEVALGLKDRSRDVFTHIALLFSLEDKYRQTFYDDLLNEAPYTKFISSLPEEQKERFTKLLFSYKKLSVKNTLSNLFSIPLSDHDTNFADQIIREPKLLPFIIKQITQTDGIEAKKAILNKIKQLCASDQYQALGPDEIRHYLALNLDKRHAPFFEEGSVVWPSNAGDPSKIHQPALGKKANIHFKERAVCSEQDYKLLLGIPESEERTTDYQGDPVTFNRQLAAGFAKVIEVCQRDFPDISTENIESFRDELLKSNRGEYSKMEADSPGWIASVKSSLEEFGVLLHSTNQSLTHTEKTKQLRYLTDGIRQCGGGALSRLQDVNLILKGETSAQSHLASRRRKILDTFAYKHQIKCGGLFEANELHIQSQLLLYAKEKALNVRGEEAAQPDKYATSDWTQLGQEDLDAFKEALDEEQTPNKILDYFVSDLENKLKEKLHFKGSMKELRQLKLSDLPETQRAELKDFFELHFSQLFPETCAMPNIHYQSGDQVDWEMLRKTMADQLVENEILSCPAIHSESPLHIDDKPAMTLSVYEFSPPIFTIGIYNKALYVTESVSLDAWIAKTDFTEDPRTEECEAFVQIMSNLWQTKQYRNYIMIASKLIDAGKDSVLDAVELEKPCKQTTHAKAQRQHPDPFEDEITPAVTTQVHPKVPHHLTQSTPEKKSSVRRLHTSMWNTRLSALKDKPLLKQPLLEKEDEYQEPKPGARKRAFS